MQELVGLRMKYRGDECIVPKVESSENCFGIVDGYRVYCDSGKRRTTHPNYIPYWKYPNFLSIDEIDLNDLPEDFVLDIKQATLYVNDLENHNTEKLKQIVQTPVLERIILRAKKIDDYPLYRLSINILPSFMGGCSAVFEIGYNYGKLHLEMNTWFMESPAVRKVIKDLNRKEIDEFIKLYKNLDFFTHERKINKIGLDGISLSFIFHDGNVCRYYDCWCPEEWEQEFQLVRYIYKFFRECFPYIEAQKELDVIRDEYLCCKEKI